MDRPLIRLDQTVHNVLSEWPETQAAFLALKTNCIGCCLARFCSLQDVAEAYKIPAEVLMDEMNEAVLEIQTKVRNKP